jgi:CubicO group peptidase (beta-lactamase class C family)
MTATMPTSTPGAQGLDSAVLAAALNRITDEVIAIDSVLVARNGHVVIDAYKFPYRGDLRRDVRSVTKSITALTAGAALADLPDFGMSQPVTPDGLSTIGHVLSMTHGLACGLAPDEAQQIGAMTRSKDWTRFVRGIPRIEPTGNVFRYCTPGYQLVCAHVAEVTGKSLAANAERLIFAPLGITDWRWPSDPTGCTVGGMGLLLRPRDMAKIGQMLLDNGRYGSHQVLPEACVEAVSAEQVKTGRGQEGYTYGFWRPPDRPGVYEMQGRGGQQVSLWPDKNLVIVVTGSGYPDEAFAPLFEGLVIGDSPVDEAPATGAKLIEAIARFEAAPIPGPFTQPGPNAARSLGVVFNLAEPDLIDLRSLSLTQAGGDGALTLKSYYPGNLTIPVGFDGVPRLAVQSKAASPTAATGVWVEPDRVRLEVTSFGLASRLAFSIKFLPDRSLSIGVSEASGQFPAVSSLARPAPRQMAVRSVANDT